MKIPLCLPYFDKEEEKAVIKVLRSGWVMQGPKVAEFEEKIASYLGVKYAVAVTSGTAALHLSMIALGLRSYNEVIVPSLTFIATANCVLYVGARPIFAEVDPETFNIDPKDVEKKISKETKAVIAVHQIGLSAAVEELQKICKKHNLFLVEDAACALGSEYRGRKVGSFGDLACFSFHPRKSITTGEGGMVTTNSRDLYEKLCSLRNHGIMKKNDEEIFTDLGYNYRMTDLQASLGLAQFKKLENILEKRLALAKSYDNAFREISYIQTPFVPRYMRHTYQSYMIKIIGGDVSRDRVVDKLKEKGIATKKGIMLIHKEPLYQKLFGKISLPISERVAKSCLILPLYAKMRREEQGYVINSLKEIL